MNENTIKTPVFAREQDLKCFINKTEVKFKVLDDKIAAYKTAHRKNKKEVIYHPPVF